jgi:uncharacterized membrane protein YheB (UPF0754 family)
MLKLEEWGDRLMDQPLSGVLGPFKETLLSVAPKLIQGGLTLAAAQMGSIVQSLDLPKMVERQVSDFPIERLEHIILSLSGKEFAAITWLGVLLGGIIGFGQSIMLTFFM